MEQPVAHSLNSLRLWGHNARFRHLAHGFREPWRIVFVLLHWRSRRGSYTPECRGDALLDGQISADGAAGVTAGGGGGAGGSVWVTVGTLAGSGTISADGGMGNGVGLGGGGGGGGGRIAVQYGVNLFFGAITALGGSGAGVGGAGTVYTKANSQPWGLVVADNGGQAGTNTTWMPERHD